VNLLVRSKPSNPKKSQASIDQHPQFLSIGYDKLRLILTDYTAGIEKATKWATYAGAALSLWATVVLSSFEFEGRRYLLTGDQWQLVFVIAATYSSIRTVIGLWSYVRRPRLSVLLGEIVDNSEVNREVRAMCIAKVRGADREYRILVYKDPIWDCYLLPHFNMADLTIADQDDENLCEFVSGYLGVDVSHMGLTYLANCDLRSRKHSEFYRQDTVYRFGFYLLSIRDTVSLPGHITSSSFTYHGRAFTWLTISEMEADQNTRNRNIDVTRHLADHSTQILQSTPDTLPTGTVNV
jgi:hypothetical protein